MSYRLFFTQLSSIATCSIQSGKFWATNNHTTQDDIACPFHIFQRKFSDYEWKLTVLTYNLERNENKMFNKCGVWNDEIKKLIKSQTDGVYSYCSVHYFALHECKKSWLQGLQALMIYWVVISPSCRCICVVYRNLELIKSLKLQSGILVNWRVIHTGALLCIVCRFIYRKRSKMKRRIYFLNNFRA